MSSTQNIPVIVSAVRTPIGAFGGAFRKLSHEDLAVSVLQAVSERIDFPKGMVDDVYWGTVMVRSDENGLARGATLKAGYPDYVSSVQGEPCLLFLHGGHPRGIHGHSLRRCPGHYCRRRGEHEQCHLQP